MTARIAIFALFLAAGAGVARGQACREGPPPAKGSIPPAQRFKAALTYEQFTAGDTARAAEWSVNYERAGSSVAEFTDRLRNLKGRWHILVVAESWCRDAANAVPYLARLADVNPNIDLRLVRIADAQDLLAAHPLTDGRKATPLVLIYDEQFRERGLWIERPAPLRSLIESKEKKISDDSLRAEVARWRAADRGRSVLAEVIALLGC